MPLLALKLVLTPLLIGAASLGGRRWGPTIGGWLVSLPLTSGPVLFFLALGHGRSFAATAAGASLAGIVPIAAVCLAYARTARSAPWPRALAVAIVAWSLAAIAISPALGLPIAPLLALVGVVAWAALLLLPPRATLARPAESPSWDILLRAAVGTSVVLLVTGVASAVGPTLSGLLATLPVIATVLAVFGHHRDGPESAIRLLRGVVIGLFGTATFLAVVAVTIEPAGIGPSFGLAILAGAAVHATALGRLRTTRGRALVRLPVAAPPTNPGDAADAPTR